MTPINPGYGPFDRPIIPYDSLGVKRKSPLKSRTYAGDPGPAPKCLITLGIYLSRRRKTSCRMRQTFWHIPLDTSLETMLKFPFCLPLASVFRFVALSARTEQREHYHAFRLISATQRAPLFDGLSHDHSSLSCSNVSRLTVLKNRE